MSGILDAASYILRTGEIQPTQIVDLAKATHGEKDRLLEFVIQFEALLLSVDTPELSRDEVLNACRDQAEAIQRSIRSAMETYRGEGNIADVARALMISTQFSQLRNAAGVRPAGFSLKYIAYTVAIVFLLLVGGSMPEHAAHAYFALLGISAGTFIWFKGLVQKARGRTQGNDSLRS